MATQFKSPEGYAFLEPESAANEENKPVYPHSKSWQSESGHSIELDDTKDRERVRIQHRSKTFIEMHPNGDEVHKVYGDGYEITLGQKNISVKGHCVVYVEGDCVVNVKGDKIEKIEGNLYTQVQGEMVTTVGKKCSIVSENDMTLGVNDTTVGMIKLRTSDCTFIEGDLSVSGAITATAMTASEKVSAKTVTALSGGFITPTGGVSVGSPTSSPAGSVVASISVNAPFINGFMVRDAAGTMLGMRTVYNAHTHVAPRGMTGTPISMMTLL